MDDSLSVVVEIGRGGIRQIMAFADTPEEESEALAIVEAIEPELRAADSAISGRRSLRSI